MVTRPSSQPNPLINRLNKRPPPARYPNSTPSKPIAKRSILSFAVPTGAEVIMVRQPGFFDGDERLRELSALMAI